MPEERNYTERMPCGHCGSSVRMMIGPAHDQREYPAHRGGGAEGMIYTTLECMACRGITVTALDYPVELGLGHHELDVIYPVRASNTPLGLPLELEKAYQAAQKVRNVEANAYGVLMGRLLELVFNEKGAEGKTLFKKMDDLAAKGSLPENVAQLAHQARAFRNIGAHATMGTLSKADVPILEDLCHAILGYLYSMPFLVSQAASRLNALKDGDGCAD